VADRKLLDEQLAYYRERAAEYDEWWERRGRYNRGKEATARWRSEIAVVRTAFDQLALDDEVVELAAGTGYWTELLAARAHRVTVLDGSAEMLAINRARLGDLAWRVEYQVVDLFEWHPKRRWDGLVHCFWISHVPRDRLDSFFETCRQALTDGATMFFLDGQRVDESTAVDHVLPDEGNEMMVRRLNDGREFRIVKNYYEPQELVDRAGTAGFELEVHRTDTYFQYGIGTAA
jgi:SAM-dependent methyltransferase